MRPRLKAQLPLREMPLRLLLLHTLHTDKAYAGTHPVEAPCGLYAANRFFAV